ncbi:MFS transporter [Fictibacillus fluitans]|uniref:MFS transporter n=1 Tax=Fictibacillus fluitans TaxID=3058422 RepID=A0ABT8HYQ9_9BACL|nr:MFS transporter [Fictibacillus sp. NE201]MDN4525915.1 MFS transporter [Fictibacillus sp. NE201]
MVIWFFINLKSGFEVMTMRNEKRELAYVTNGDSPDPMRWWALAVVCLATFMTMLDSFIVNVAAPTISTDLHADPAEIQFIIAGYTIAYGIFLVTGGRLGDIFGAKRLFIIGMLGFTIASVLCGISITPFMLIGSRIIQGITASLMVPQVLAYIQNSFQEDERKTAMSTYGAVIGISTIVGQVAGGLLLKLNLFQLGWRMIFLINVPIGVLALIGAVYLIRSQSSAKEKYLDLGGVALLGSALLFFLIPIISEHDLNWPVKKYIYLVLSFALFVSFLLYEKKLGRKSSGMPLVQFRLFKNKAFSVGLLIVFSFFSGNAATFFIMAFYLQEELGFTALQAAYSYTPLGIGFLIGSFIVPKMIDKWKLHTLRLGAGLMVIGVGMLMATFYYFQENLVWQHLIIAMGISGIGQGLVATPLVSTILKHTEAKEAGTASGVLSTVTVIAQAIGVSIIGSIYFALKGMGHSLDRSAHSFQLSLIFILGLALAVGLLLFFMPEKNDKKKVSEKV